MDFIKKYNEINYLFLDKFHFSDSNDLLLVVSPAFPDDKQKDLNIAGNIIKDTSEVVSSNFIIEFNFQNILSLNILNESYGVYDDKDSFEGNIIRLHKNSSYVKYVLGHSIIEDLNIDIKGNKKPLYHLEIITVNQVFNIISATLPCVREIDLKSVANKRKRFFDFLLRRFGG